MTPRLTIEFKRIAPLLTARGREELLRRLEEGGGRVILNLGELLRHVSNVS